MARVKQKICFAIIDGFGFSDDTDGNAISLAKTPTWDEIRSNYPSLRINASGEYVGLPEGIMGNSEVGHLTIGTGRITFQSLELINRSFADGSIKSNPVIKKIKDHLINTKGDLHLMGLLSDGAVHSHQNHLYDLIKIFSSTENNTWIHAFMDGRDTPPDSGVTYITELQNRLEQFDKSKLASVIGRYYAMDRDNKWARIEIAYNMLTKMDGENQDPVSAIKQRYQEGETDEFIKPLIVNNSGKMKPGDAVLFFNFRPDRAKQITMAINNQANFETKPIENLFFTTMTKYVKSWEYPSFFESREITNSLGEIVAKNRKRLCFDRTFAWGFYNLKSVRKI